MEIQNLLFDVGDLTLYTNLDPTNVMEESHLRLCPMRLSSLFSRLIRDPKTYRKTDYLELGAHFPIEKNAMSMTWHSRIFHESLEFKIWVRFVGYINVQPLCCPSKLIWYWVSTVIEKKIFFKRGSICNLKRKEIL